MKAQNYKKGGRKPILDPAIHFYGFKLNSVENAKFLQLLQKSGIEDKSKFIKASIFAQKIKVVKIDKATTDYYIRLSNFYTQFQAIGNNYNQAVKTIHHNFGEKRAFQLTDKLIKHTIELIFLSKQIIKLTLEFEEKYLANRE